MHRGAKVAIAVLSAAFGMPLHASESAEELDSLNAAVCAAAAAEIGKLAASRETPIAVSFRDAPEFASPPPGIDDETMKDYKKMIESDAKRVIAPPSLRACVRDRLVSVRIKAVFDNAPDDLLKVTVFGGRVEGDSGTAEFTHSLSPTVQKRGHSDLASLQFHRENGKWIYDQLTYRKMSQLCPVTGCT